MVGTQDISFGCTCGKLKGTLRGVDPRKDTHAICCCSDCRAAELHLGQDDPGLDGVGIFQTDPHKVEIISGEDHLDVMSFGEKNLLRWHASCCGAPLFNTMRNPKFAFVGVRTNRLHDTSALGPIIARGFVAAPDGKYKHEGLRRLIGRTLSRMIRARLSGSWKKTPFFDIATLTPLRDVQVLPKGTRASVLPER